LTLQRLFQEPNLPAKKDQAGRWVMVDVDYYLSLRGLIAVDRQIFL
jgi:hypothetical protein